MRFPKTCDIIILEILLKSISEIVTVKGINWILSTKCPPDVYQMSTCSPFTAEEKCVILIMRSLARFEKSCVAPKMKFEVLGY